LSIAFCSFGHEVSLFSLMVSLDVLAILEECGFRILSGASFFIFFCLFL
jgi:hypothetical protein